MKICFMWVKKFRNFDSFGLNLSSDYLYEFNEVTNNISRTKKNNLPTNFYGDDVEDVTGLFGINGSGKTNCLELICKLLKGGKSKVKSDFLVVYEHNQKIYCEISMKDKGYIFPKSNFAPIYKYYDKDIRGINVVYFSNVYDRRPNDFSIQVSDLSLNCLAKKNKYKFNSFIDQINFIESNKFSLLGIPVPNQFCIEIDIILKLKHTVIKTMFEKYLHVLHRLVKRRLIGLQPHTKFILALNYSAFLTFLNLLENEYTETLENNDINLDKYFSVIIHEKISSKELASRLMILTTELSYQLLKGKGDAINDFEYYLEQVEDIGKHYSSIEISNIKNSYIKESFLVNYKNSELELMPGILKCLRNNERTFCSWMGVSSGHLAYLNLFSSIYKELHRSRNDVILCIDEGDLYLHPQWQIEFFDKLLNVLPNLSSGKVQIILTSHSPFLLSDLPNQSINVLNSNERGEAISGCNIEQKTFGANLYELYSKLFFLNNNRTGVFANNKIKKLLKQIESTDVDISPEDTKLFSEMIGDKVIKHILDKG